MPLLVDDRVWLAELFFTVIKSLLKPSRPLALSAVPKHHTVHWWISRITKPWEILPLTWLPLFKKLKLLPSPLSRMQALFSCFLEHPMCIQELDWEMKWGQNLELEWFTGVGTHVGKWSSCSCWDSGISEGITRCLGNAAVNQSWEGISISGQHQCGEGGITSSPLCDSYLCGLVFTIPVKKQTPGGRGPCSMSPGTEIKFKHKPVCFEGLCWSTILHYLHRVSFGAFRIQNCCIE